MQRAIFHLALVVASITMLASCGGHADGEPTTPDGVVPPPAELTEPPRLRDLVDLDAPLVIEADVAALRGAWFYERIVETINQVVQQELNAQRQEVVRSAWDTFSRTTGAVIAIRDEDHITIALRGQYELGDIRRVLSLNDDVQERQGDGYVVLIDDDAGLALLRDHTIVLGRMADLEVLFDRYARRVRARPPGDAIASMLEAVHAGTSPIAVAGQITPAVTELLDDAPEPLRLAVQKLSTVGVQIGVGEGLDIRILGRAPDAATASDLARSIQAEVDTLRRHPVAIILGLRGILGAIRVEITLSLTREQVDSLLRSASAFLAPAGE